MSLYPCLYTPVYLVWYFWSPYFLHLHRRAALWNGCPISIRNSHLYFKHLYNFNSQLFNYVFRILMKMLLFAFLVYCIPAFTLGYSALTSTLVSTGLFLDVFNEVELKGRIKIWIGNMIRATQEQSHQRLPAHTQWLGDHKSPGFAQMRLPEKSARITKEATLLAYSPTRLLHSWAMYRSCSTTLALYYRPLLAHYYYSKPIVKVVFMG